MSFQMFLAQFRPVWDAAREGAGGEGGDPGAGGAGGEAGQGGDGGAAGAGGAGGDPGAGASHWWEDQRFGAETQSQLKSLGLTVDDPLDAVAKLAGMEQAAKKKLGKGVDALIEKPGEGQDVGEWLRGNGALFGIPDSPDGYKLAAPEGWPEGMEWDADFEGKARALAHEAGVPQAALEKFTGLYAEKIQSVMEAANQDYAAAAEAMQGELVKDWGDQYGAKVAQAQQAAQALAAQAGMDADAMTALAGAMKEKVGDANIIRLFAAVGDMMGEDTLVRTGTEVAMTPVQARTDLEAMKRPDSDYMKAAAKVRQGGPRAEYDRLHQTYLRLQKLAAQ